VSVAVAAPAGQITGFSAGLQAGSDTAIGALP
jgi:hypothetical protein